MEINGSYQSNSIANIFATELDASNRYSKVQSTTTPSGDTVDISSEAKKLYSEMIHKYDHADSSAGSAPEGGKTGGGQSLDDSSSGKSVEDIKKQIQSLKSQLSALASQAGGGENAAVMGKMSALQAQIAALEAQLNEAQAAA